MGIDYSVLKTECEKPEYNSYYLAGNDTGLAAALNTSDVSISVRLPTVPFFYIHEWAASNGRYLKLEAAAALTDPAPEVQAVKNAAKVALKLFDSFNGSDPFDISRTKLQELLDGFVLSGVLSADDKTAFNNLNLRSPASRAEELFGAGTIIISDDIAKTR